MMPDGGECCPGYVALYDAYWHLLRARPTAATSAPVAWLDMRNEPTDDWTERVVATNPKFVEKNGPHHFAPLFAAPPSPDPVEIELLRQKLEFAEWEWNRATEGMQERDATIADLSKQLVSTREATLRMVAGLFEESVHETWSRAEVVSIVEDMIKLGKPSATDEERT